LGLPYYAEIARIAELGKLDSLFLADNIAIAEYRVEYMPQTLFDPIEVLSALAALTERIGLIATGSTTYSAPWDLARRFATLDFLSAGRAGWNIVTTSSVLTAANFGRSEHPSHAERYARASEFVDVVRRVWDGWEDDAVVGSKETGVWADRSKLHAPRYRGEHYEVAGILPFPRSPQGHPVLVQAGASVAGIDLAAHYAELVFTRQPTLEDAADFRRELRAQVAAAGRSPDHVHVLPALTYTLASTEAEARARQDELEELASPEFRWRNMLWNVGLDPDGFDPDVPLPEELLAGPAPTSGAERLFAAARGERVPLRELAPV
jgi:FMN-dependent oxidoreductase (nitrilotriacetate monooxygenase family)